MTEPAAEPEFAGVELAAECLTRAPGSLIASLVREDGETTLAINGDVAVTAMRAPDGELWASMARTDGQGLAEVPFAELEALPHVLAAAERQLAELGVLRLAGDLRN